MNSLLDRITINPATCHGKPTIRGLRYPVDMLRDLFAVGASSEEILADDANWKGPTSAPCSPMQHSWRGHRQRNLPHAQNQQTPPVRRGPNPAAGAGGVGSVAGDKMMTQISIRSC
jgi:hypothetical protein